MPSDLSKQVQDHILGQKEEIVKFLMDLTKIESPSLSPETQLPVQEFLREPLESLGFQVKLRGGEKTGGHLYAMQETTSGSNAPRQLLLGHTDTVWPIGTVKHMPVIWDKAQNIVRGPGVFDMKGGITQMIFALKALDALGCTSELTTTILLNSDEEIGSAESQPYIEKYAQRSGRVFVMEPALGTNGLIKTTRRGVGQFEIKVVGKAAHSGLAPEEGASAIQEMSHVIQQLQCLNRPEEGLGINVGTVAGGTRANVVAATCSAVVDVRVSNQAQSAWIDGQIRNLKTTVAGTHLEISGGVDRAPMESNARNTNLWNAVRDCGTSLGVHLVGGQSGGASDGNITSLYTATLDGLGSIGDGAHALHEYICVNGLLERTALLTLAILLPNNLIHQGD
ncbi:MAG TPA: M20 family peptidase [Gemmatimonadetes bacterium]|jgi:glutamate carboxypeptidase|nr:M20 family peptidase [Gemmatimonadota bacterium]